MKTVRIKKYILRGLVFLCCILFVAQMKVKVVNAAESWNGEIYRYYDGQYEMLMQFSRMGQTTDYTVDMISGGKIVSFLVRHPSVTSTTFSGEIVKYAKPQISAFYYPVSNSSIKAVKVNSTRTDITMIYEGIGGTDTFYLYKAGGTSKVNLKTCSVAAIGKKYYTGHAIKPSPNITYNGQKLTKNKDYTLKYKNNIKKGTATIEIKGKGNFTGTKKITFKIVAKPKLTMSKTKVSLSLKKTCTLSIKKSNITGKITWSTSNPKIAVVNQNGKVTAKAAGTAKIKAKANGVTAACTVTVTGKASAKIFDLKSYLTGIGPGTKTDMSRLIKKVGKMKKKSSSKYPDLYYSGNKMTVGLNLDARYGSAKNIYLIIENTGNKNVKYYGIKIGDSKATVLKKLKQMRYKTYDGGETYSNANAFTFAPVFKNGKLKSFKYISVPTS